jgi:hypothetical protein
MFDLSSALVAMGFIAQTPRLFTSFVATVLAVVFLVGWFAFVWLADPTVETGNDAAAT